MTEYMKVNKYYGCKWERYLQAPKVVIAYYQAMEAVHIQDAFRACHVYTKGRRPRCLPLAGEQICSTIGCINPRHWTRIKPLPERATRSAKLPAATKMEMIELLKYYQDKLEGETYDFDKLRAVIPEEDISDEQLYQMIHARD